MARELKAKEIYEGTLDLLERGGGNGYRKVIDALHDDAVRQSRGLRKQGNPGRSADYFESLAEAIHELGVSFNLRNP